MVYRLGTGHVHRAPRIVSGDGTARRGARHPHGMGGHDFRRNASQPVSRSGGFVRIQFGRRFAMVYRRRSRIPGGDRPRAAAGGAGREKSAQAGCPRDLERILLRNALRNSLRRRRLAGRGSSRHAVDMDGRQGSTIARSRDGSASRSKWKPFGSADCESERPSIPVGRAFSIAGWPRSRRGFGIEPGGCLFDVVDVDHRKGTVDETLRPNQIFAVGGLPWTFLDSKAARRVVDVVESRLWTPMGLRTLEPGAPGYCGRYLGSERERELAYHQGTVWPWLAGPFVEAWVRVRGPSPTVCDLARSRFVEPLIEHLDVAGLGHVSEIADGDPPHTPRGCPFQAWSLAELIRLTESVLPSARQDT